MPKKCFMLFLPAILALWMVSCATETPYSSMSGWVMRQNAIPRYFAPYDIFFIPPSVISARDDKPREWTRQKETERIYNFVYYQLSEQFGTKVRFFVPLIHHLEREEAEHYLDAPPETFRETPFEPVIENTVEAFRYYLKNYHVPGRPFIIAGQGQGALAAYEMMKRCHEITPENGFVAAYLTGMPGLRTDRIAKDFEGRGIRPARGMTDTGVILGWCIQGHSEPKTIPPDPERCVINPLSWRTDEEPAAASANSRSVLYNEFDPNPLERRIEAKKFCGAVIDKASGTLKILPDKTQVKVMRFIDGQKFPCNDMGLFLQSILTNMRNRVDQYRHEILWRSREQRAGRRK